MKRYIGNVLNAGICLAGVAAIAGIIYAQPQATVTPELPKRASKPDIKTHWRRPGIRAHVTGTSYNPPAVARRYDFPNGVTGKGALIGVIELGGAFNSTDLQQFMGGLGLPVPTVKVVSVNGAVPTSDGPNGADGEVQLDVQIIASVAPGATQNVYFANNTSADFLAAFKQARADGCTIVSCSWGGPEDQWSASDLAAFNAEFQAGSAAGVNYFVAAGDNGSGDGESGLHVDFPGSSPYVICCGGTSLPASGAETVWNDGANSGATGGGISSAFAKAPWQPSLNGSTNRLVPDIAGCADPSTGYTIQIDGVVGTIGGTSAVAPLFSALTALYTEKLGKNPGFLGPQLYGVPNPYAAAFVDIVAGNNGQYLAGAGFDLCTGIGRPDGSALLTALAGGTTTPPVNPPQPPVTPPTTGKLFTLTVTREVRKGGRVSFTAPVAIPPGKYDVIPETAATGANAVAE